MRDELTDKLSMSEIFDSIPVETRKSISKVILERKVSQSFGTPVLSVDTPAYRILHDTHKPLKQHKQYKHNKGK